MAKTETPGAALAVRKSTDIAALDELDNILRTGMAPQQYVEDDPAIVQRQIIEELLEAETDAELEYVGSAVGWQELEGVPVEIHGFKWRPSEYKDGPPVYCIVFVTTMDDATRKVVTTGSAGIMAQLSNMARRGRIPGAIRKLVRAEKPTKGGFYPLRLVTPEGVTNAPEGTAE